MVLKINIQYISQEAITGEKPYEEFYTKDESVSLNKYQALGVVVNSKLRKISELNNLLDDLNKAFDDERLLKKIL